MNFAQAIWKRKAEDFLLWPFILLGKGLARLRPLRSEYGVFFFFPFYHTGGAEKVHAQIAKACGGPGAVIFFTRRSHNDTFRQLFEESGCRLYDISRYTDNKWLYFCNFIARGIISDYINRQAQPAVVFNGQCNFGYKISPWIHSKIPQLELIHSLNSFSYIRIPFLPFYKATVMISRKRIQDHLELYKQRKIPEHFAQRIRYISNAAALPAIDSAQKPTQPFQVLFSGRGSAEKRVSLFLSIAREVQQVCPDIRFRIVGNMEGFADPDPYPGVAFSGEVKDPATLWQQYIESQVLLLTSSTEGFPLVVIEAMAAGCAIAATPVGDIPEHVNHFSGRVFRSVTDESAILQEATEQILYWYQHSEACRIIGTHNIQYAAAHFSITAFNQAYRELFEAAKSSV